MTVSGIPKKRELPQSWLVYNASNDRLIIGVFIVCHEHLEPHSIQTSHNETASSYHNIINVYGLLLNLIILTLKVLVATIDAQ